MVETSSLGEMTHVPPSYLAEWSSARAGFWCHDTLSQSPYCHFSPLLSFHISRASFCFRGFNLCLALFQVIGVLSGQLQSGCISSFFCLCILMRLLHLGPLHLAFSIFVLLPVSIRHFIKVRCLIHCIHESKKHVCALLPSCSVKYSFFLGVFFPVIFPSCGLDCVIVF